MVGRAPVHRLWCAAAPLAALEREAELEAHLRRTRATQVSQTNLWGGAIDDLRYHGHEVVARRLAAKALAPGGPADVRAPTLRYTALYALGRFAEARAVVDTMRASPLVLRWRGAAAARAGDAAAAERALAALAPFDSGYARRGVAVQRAGILAALDRRDEAVRALEEARRLGRWVNAGTLVGPGYESLRGYPPADALIAPVD